MLQSTPGDSKGTLNSLRSIVKKPYFVPVGIVAASLVPDAALGQAVVQGDQAPDHGRGIDHAASVKLRQRVAAAPSMSPQALVALQAGTRFAATLTVAQEAPLPPVAGVGAGGRLTGTLQGRLFSWRLTFHNLSTPAVAAVLHEGLRGHVGARISQLCGHCSSGTSGVVVLTPAQVTELLAGRTYINIGTSRNPTGEVRGQVHRIVPSVTAPVPVPPVGGHVSHVSHSSHVSHASHSSHVSSG